MRTITDHRGSAANNELRVAAIDGDDHAYIAYRYEIEGFDATKHPANLDVVEGQSGPHQCTLLFQEGPVDLAGVNGITDEALVAIVIDRMRAFQGGGLSCRENASALNHFEEGLMWLLNRTRDRQDRGVEGRNVK